jgi:hypothetical protein
MAFNANDDAGASDWFTQNSPPVQGPGVSTTPSGSGGVTFGPPMTGPGGATFYQGSDGKVYDSNHTVVNVPNQTPNAPFGQQAYGSPPPTWTPPAASGDPASQFQSYLAKYPGNPQAAIDAWNAAGDPGGLKPAWEAGSQTIGLANGTYLVMPGTGGNSGSGWQTVTRGNESGGGSAAASSPLSADLLAPFTEKFSYQPFTAPTGVTDQNDPGYTARLTASDDALQRGAAAKGTLLTGQTLKDLDTNSQTFASNEYQNVYNRAAQDYNTNYGNAYNQYLGRESTFYANQNNPFAKLLSQETLDSQNSNAANQINLGYAGLNSSNLNAQNNLNYNYASLYGNTLGNGANTYGNYLTQGGNANAAGYIANGNIWGNAFNNIGNTSLGLYYNSQKPQTPSYGQYGGY